MFSCFHTMLSLCKVQYRYNSRCLVSYRVVLHDNFSSLKETTQEHSRICHKKERYWSVSEKKEGSNSPSSLKRRRTYELLYASHTVKYFHWNGWEDIPRVLFEFWQILVFISKYTGDDIKYQFSAKEGKIKKFTSPKSAVYHHVKWLETVLPNWKHTLKCSECTNVQRKVALKSYSIFQIEDSVACGDN